MREENAQRPSYERFANFEGTSAYQHDTAFREWRENRRREDAGGGMMSGGRLMFGTPRKGKCRDTKVNGLRIK